MHTEVHVHGDVALKRGISASDVEVALRPWFDYIDVDSIAEATSAREGEPGISFDVRRRVLQICWTGWVGRNFQRAVEEALAAIGPLAERTAEIELSFYHEDGRDEFAVTFVGPSAEAIEQAKRNRMIQEVSMLLGRQFNDAEIGEVIAVVERIFAQRQASGTNSSSTAQSIRGPLPGGTKHLH